MREMSRRERAKHAVPVVVAIIAAAGTIAAAILYSESASEKTAHSPSVSPSGEAQAVRDERSRAASVVADTPSQQQPLRVGGDVQPPILIKKVEPQYSSGVRRQAGRIILEGIVTKEGDIRDLRVIRGAADPMSAAVVTAVRQWKFRPATRNGKPVDVIYNVATYIHVR
jgi:TonB family protein